jgi:hypothetical protein
MGEETCDVVAEGIADFAGAIARHSIEAGTFP